MRGRIGSLVFCVVVPLVAMGADPNLQLAMELVDEGDRHGAAVEFRRMALAESDALRRGGYLWASAHEYFRAGNLALAEKMLDRAEDDAPEIGPMAFFLRGETAVAAKETGEAMFYLESMLRHSDASDEIRNLAARRLATVYVQEGKLDKARATLDAAPGDHDGGLQALDLYATARDKKPRLGGWLGLVPGLGYAYAGEYDNALRSLILNGLFIWGMVETADDDQWGGFAVITFFEITWYSGSIYGGIDASHRYNRDRLDQCTDAINDTASFQPIYERLPTLALKFEF